MGEFAFPPGLHLKKPSEFRTVFDRGVKRHTRGFVLFRAANALGRPRLGVSVGRKVGGAVARNRIKRLVREAFRLNWRTWELAGSDLVVVAKRGADHRGLPEVAREFSAALPARGRT
jgi:ribonuclease P protein component